MNSFWEKMIIKLLKEEGCGWYGIHFGSPSSYDENFEIILPKSN